METTKPKDSTTPLAKNKLYLFPLLLSLGVLFSITAILLICHQETETYTPISFSELIANFLILLPLFSLILLISRRYIFSTSVTSLLLMLLLYIDGVVYRSRLVHLHLSDFMSVLDAMAVSSGYSLAPSANDLINLIIIIAGVVILIAVKKIAKVKFDLAVPKRYRSRWHICIIGAALCLLSSLLLLMNAPLSLISDSKGREMFEKYNRNSSELGLPLALYEQIAKSSVSEPDNYSLDLASKIQDSYLDNSVNPTPQQQATDVIIIMNESFADYSLLGQTQFADPLVAIKTSQPSLFSGRLNVSVFGGGTAQTEFEFLTGASLYLLPTETLPYNSLIKSSLASLATDFKAQSYSVSGVHPFYGEEWNRRQVYNFLGFEQFIAGEDFNQGLQNSQQIKDVFAVGYSEFNFGDNLEYIRNFISDAECYHEVMEVLAEKPDANNFVFAVTVQNHGSYTYGGEGFTAYEYIKDAPELNQYLTLAEISSKTFVEFLAQLQDRDKRTVVLMFGDHQPGLDFSDYIEYTNPDSPQHNYLVPYYVWANFDLDYSKLPLETSANYLSAYFKKVAHLPLTAWDQLRLTLAEQWPVVAGNYLLDGSGTVYARDEIQTPLNDYAIVQYARLFDGLK